MSYYHYNMKIKMTDSAKV